MSLVTSLPGSDRSPALEAHIDLEAAAQLAAQQDHQQQSHLPGQADLESSLPDVAASTCWSRTGAVAGHRSSLDLQWDVATLP